MTRTAVQQARGFDPVFPRPPWLKPRARVWFYRSERVIKEVSERGVVLAQYRRGLNPSHRLLTPQEAALALETGELRPMI